MKLKITNIGPFVGEHEIQIDGITILAGKNGTGKSTFGKVLYCLFSAFHNIDEQIENDKRKTIWRLLRNTIRVKDPLLGTRKNNATIGNLLDLFFPEEDIELSRSEVYNILSSIYASDDKKEELDELTDRIIEVLELENHKILENILQNRIVSEFGNQIGNLNHKSNVSATLTVNNQKILIQMAEEKTIINHQISLVKSILYIDDPNIINGMDDYFVRDYDGSHRGDLLEKLRKYQRGQVSSADQILNQERIQRIEEKLNLVCDGNILITDSHEYRYRSEEYKEGLSLCNMATGLKSFALLKKMLKDGYLEENGIIILDEPEIHLHPEWQRAWAEIIVLLNKELGINILLSTHSSDFLGFLELFIRKYEVDENSYLYLLNKERATGSSVKDVSDEWNLVYEQLGKPFIKATEEMDAINDSR